MRHTPFQLGKKKKVLGKGVLSQLGRQAATSRTGAFNESRFWRRAPLRTGQERPPPSLARWLALFSCTAPGSSGLFVDLRVARHLLPRGAVTTPLFAFASSASPRAQRQQQPHRMPASEGQPVEPLLLVLLDLPRAFTEAKARFAFLPLYGAVALNASKDVVASLCCTFLPRPGSLYVNKGCPCF